jgi:hypothetical protein
LPEESLATVPLASRRPYGLTEKRAPAHARKVSGLAAVLLGFGLGLVLALSSPAAATPADGGDPGHAVRPDPLGWLAFTGGDVTGLAMIGAPSPARGSSSLPPRRRRSRHHAAARLDELTHTR